MIAIAKYTFLSHFRNKIFLILILFGFILLSSGLLLGILSQEQEIRMLIDLGLVAIEKLSLLTSVFLMVNLILEEMESKTIYLVLTRSISRGGYLWGRFLGTMASTLISILIMVAAHLLLLWMKGWNFQDGALYFLALFTSFEKIFLISSLTLFFTLFSSSNVVALTFTFFFWILGHFALELKFLIQSVKNDWAQQCLNIFYHLIPHFQYLNARDLWTLFFEKLPSLVLQGTLYTFSYSALALGLALFVFKKKEF